MRIRLKDLNRIAKLVGFNCQIELDVISKMQYSDTEFCFEFFAKGTGEQYVFTRNIHGYHVSNIPDEVIIKSLEQDALQFRESIVRTELKLELAVEKDISNEK